MTTVSFPSRFPAQHPERLQLYSLATPNGKKAGIMLEETGLPYEAHRVNIMEGHQFDADFVALNPNSKIPTLLDPKGPGGEPLAIMESGAILIYLAEKSGTLLSSDPRVRNQTLQWLFFQVGSVGPMFGQFGHFYKFAKGKTDAYGEQRYGKETTRLLGVLDKRLADRDWLVGEYSIADIATVPWITSLDFYEGKDFVEYERFTNVHAWVERFEARDAVQRGAKVAGF